MRTTAAIGRALVALTLLGAASASAATLDPVAPGVPGNGRAWELVTPAEPVAARVLLSEFGAPSDDPPIVSTSGDRFEYQTRGALPGADFGSWLSRNIAIRGPDGWDNEPLPYPQPDSLLAIFLVTGIEGLAAVSPELTKSVWVAGVTPSDGSGNHLGIYSGTPGGPYSFLVEIGTGGVAGATPDFGRIFFSSERPLAPDVTNFSLYEYSEGAVKLVSVKGDGTAMTCGGEFIRAFPTNGEAFFVASSDCSTPAAQTHTFLRADGQTTDISASQCTLPDCGPEAEVTFLGVSADGSTAFLASKQRLTNADNEGAEMAYRYDVSSGTLSQLYQQPAGSTATRPNGLRSANDGSRVYFSAEGQLLPGQGAESGQNLYLADGADLHFVAPIWDPGKLLVSADGRYAVFTSAARLVPSDSDESVDVYRYDATSGGVQLVSTGPSGGNGAFEASLTRVARVVDANRRVLFRTAEPLLAQDQNDKDDVYEWTGSGLSLVSGGVPGLGAELVGSSADAKTVFFRTSATLLPRDRDNGELDVYAARIGGGFPEPEEEAAPSCCVQAPGGRSPHRPPPSGPGVVRRLELAPLDAQARRQLAATGSTVLLAETPAAGQLTATARALGGRSFLAATGKARASAPGPVRLRLRLTARARKALADGRLRLRLVVALAPGGAKRGAVFALRG